MKICNEIDTERMIYNLSNTLKYIRFEKDTAWSTLNPVMSFLTVMALIIALVLRLGSFTHYNEKIVNGFVLVAFVSAVISVFSYIRQKCINTKYTNDVKDEIMERFHSSMNNLAEFYGVLENFTRCFYKYGNYIRNYAHYDFVRVIDMNVYWKHKIGDMVFLSDKKILSYRIDGPNTYPHLWITLEDENHEVSTREVTGIDYKLNTDIEEPELHISNDRIIFIDKYVKKTEDSIEKARRFCVRCWMGFGCSNNYRNGFKSGQQTISPNPAKAWSKLPETIEIASERLKGVQIENLPAIELLNRYDTSDVFMYIDPPYLHGTRKNYLYKYEMEEDDHVQLLKKLKFHPGKIMISGYDNELYNNMLKGWHKEIKKTQAESGLSRIETIWMNYDVSTQMSFL